MGTSIYVNWIRTLGVFYSPIQLTLLIFASTDYLVHVPHLPRRVAVAVVAVAVAVAVVVVSRGRPTYMICPIPVRPRHEDILRLGQPVPLRVRCR